MNVINYLEQLDTTTKVQVFLYENNYLQIIADTTAEVLLLSSKPVFRSLKVISVGNHNNKVILTVVKP